MNIKPTIEQVIEWGLQAGKYARELEAEGHEFDEAFMHKQCELAAAWGAEQAQQTTEVRDQDFWIGVCESLDAYKANDAVARRVSFDGGKTWAIYESGPPQQIRAEAIVQPLCTHRQAQQTTVEEPELPEAVAVVSKFNDLGGEIDWTSRTILPVGAKVYTAAQMHDHFAAGVRAGAAGSQDAKRYRWLRDEARRVDWARNFKETTAYVLCNRVTPEQMDRDIDLAMQGDKQ